MSRQPPALGTEARLSRWEILGAWLHIWTPRRGVDVPPVPWRKTLLWAIGGVVAIAVGVAIVVPRIDEGKRAGASKRARELAAADNAERARLRADQRVHTLRVAAGADLVASLEAAIKADAQDRARAKTITGPVLSTRCGATSAGVSRFPESRVYKCFVTTATGIRGQGSDVLSTGYPFVATIYTAQRRVAWCKQNPHADEKGSRGDVRVRTSPICAGKLSEVL